MRRTILSLGIALTLQAGLAVADTEKPARPEITQEQAAAFKQEIDRVQQKLKMTFSNVAPEFLGPGPLPGLYEMLVGGRIIYYVPDKDWLLFGEFFNSDGLSETQRRLSELRAETIKSLPLDQAITVGNGPNEVIEFVDPDCPFCKAWEHYAQQRHDLTRHIFIVPLDALHPTARAKAEHALCASDPGKTLGDFLTGRLGTAKLVSCEEGKRRLAAHEAAARKLGVTGTPTLVINGTLISGFNKARISTLLKQPKEDQ